MFAQAHYNLANLLADRGRMDEAITHYQKVLEIDPRNVNGKIGLAWLLATHSDGSFRNATRAIELARQADELTDGKNPAVGDALAAAYAAAGRFPEALAAGRKALELAWQQNNQALADALRARIALYEAGKPYHQPLSASAPTKP